MQVASARDKRCERSNPIGTIVIQYRYSRLVGATISSHKLRSILLLLHPINKHIDLLIIEASEASNARGFSSRILVPPQDIFMRLAVDRDVVVVGHTFIRTPGRCFALCDILPLELDAVSAFSVLHVSTWALTLVLGI
jgi:hypothetical protein